MNQTEQAAYWRRVRYRGPEDPVVVAYARPKLDLIERVLPLRGRTVLDVGCGPGIFSHHLRQRAARVVGVDVNAELLSCVKGIETVQADATQLPFAAASFDVAFEANLLHHAARPEAVLAEMARVAGTAVVLIEPNRLNPVMFAFSLLVRAERGGLRSSRRYLEHLLAQADLAPRGFWTTGMISQNQTPATLVPLLRSFDFNFPFGEYHVAVAGKTR